MKKVMIVGAGGVGQVVAHKCAQLNTVFSDIILASRTIDKCNLIADQIKHQYDVSIETASVDADNVAELVSLLSYHKPFQTSLFR